MAEVEIGFPACERPHLGLRGASCYAAEARRSLSAMLEVTREPEQRNRILTTLRALNAS